MKWLFVDFDGTLKNNDKEFKITNEDYQFIEKWKAEGNKLVLTTGRPFVHMKRHFDENYQIKPDFYICSTGDTIHSQDGKLIMINYLNENLKNFILEFVKENRKSISSLIYSIQGDENFLYFDGWKPENSNFFIYMYPTNKEISFLETKKIICLKLVLHTGAFKKLNEKYHLNNLDAYWSTNTIGDITTTEVHNSNSSKGKAIKYLASLYNIDNKDIIVTGDDYNDLSMFEYYYENSYMVKHEHNKTFRDKVKYLIDHVYEIEVK